jgi:hypothetical protein
MLLLATVWLAALPLAGQSVPVFRNLFNGKDLTGWVNVNTDEDTWTVKEGVLILQRPTDRRNACSDKQYENFILHIEWKHIEAGGKFRGFRLE